MNKKILLTLASAALIMLAACDSSQQSNSSQKSNTTQQLQAKTYETVNNIAWMREKLPARTLAYLRIPTIWNLFFEAKVDALHSVQKLEAHKNQIQKLKDSLVNNYSGLLPLEAQLPFSILLKNMVTPLEIAVLNAKDGSMIPNVMLATTLKNTSRKALRSMIETLMQKSRGKIRILEDFNDAGQLKMMLVMSPLFVSFDETNGKLILLSGLSASQKELDEILAQKQHDPALNDIFAFENRVDVAGQNSEIWLNIHAIYQQNQAFIPVTEKQTITTLGLDKAKFLWVGTAANQGRSQFIMHLAMPEVGFRQFLPRVDSNFDVQTAGVPKSTWQIALPSVKQIKQAYAFFLKNYPQIQKNDALIVDRIKQINKFLGVTLTEIYQTYGQKVLLISDDSGFWFANKILDQAKHKQILEKLKSAFDAEVKERKLAGVKIFQVRFTSEKLQKIVFGEDLFNKMQNKLFSKKQTAYYQFEDDYLLSAFIPQVLADRKNNKHKISLQKWLKNQQQQSWQTAIVAHSYLIQDAPRDIYHMYLGILPLLAQVFNTQVDLFTLPSAQQLQLPQTGRYGFSLDSSANDLTFNLYYEYNILENMSLLDSYFSIASLGIVAAYAVPAYRDYTVRSKIGSKLYARPIIAAKLEVAQFYAKNNKFPKQKELKALQNNKQSYQYDATNGAIIIKYTRTDDHSLAGKTLKLIPIDKNGHLQWYCQTKLPSRWLPHTCRNIIMK